MASADRLSGLADDLLQRILSFAPAKEAAASAALSRRWRPLWRRTGALNLDSRPYSRQHSRFYHGDRFDDFFRHGKAALASRLGTALKRLTLYLLEDAYLVGDKWHYRRNDDVVPEYDTRVAGLLADPAATALEELRIAGECAFVCITIEDIVSDDCYRYGDQTFTGDQKPGEEVILPTFLNLRLLEIDASFNYRDSNTASALATLLRACPAMSELRLRLNMNRDYHYDRETKEQVGGPFAQSTESFNRLGSMCAKHRDDVELGGVSELPAAFANSCTFGCLRTSLRKVTLQFKSNEHNCFQVQLARFLVENAMVLEEMHVEDGNQFWPDHLLGKLTRWRADAFRLRNLPDTAGFQVFQLANPVVDPEVNY
uniref:F-box domain-containing protein n=1 Tax=Aegilops tauschii TaxID=37682 RepID=M8BJZ1_AEGTA